MTIPKNTRLAKQVIANAVNIRCYSFSNCFRGEPLTESPVVWGGPVVNGRYSELVHLTQREFLAHQLSHFTFAKLHKVSDGHYTLNIHGNLWYEFDTHEHDFVLQADDTRLCACGEGR